MRSELGINLASDITSFHSFAVSAQQTATALLTARIPFVVNDFCSETKIPTHRAIYHAVENLLVFHARKDTSMSKYISETNPHPINLIQLSPHKSHTIRTTHPSYFRDRKNVVICAWEFPQIPSVWASYLRPFDEIWAVSNFVRQALSRTIPRVRTMVPAVTINKSSLNFHLARQRFRLKKRTYIFLFAFTGFWLPRPTMHVTRKNPFAVVEAFRRAFTGADDAVLIIKAPPRRLIGIMDLKSYAVSYLRRKARVSRSNILYLEDHLSRNDFMSLISSCDCFVSLHRAEGFGLILAEAMHLGKPVIATGYSGNLDFMTKENSLLVRNHPVLMPQGLERDLDGGSSEAYTWAEPDIDQASGFMRWVYEHREEARLLGKRGAQHVQNLLSPLRVGQEIREKCAQLS